MSCVQTHPYTQRRNLACCTSWVHTHPWKSICVCTHDVRPGIFTEMPIKEPCVCVCTHDVWPGIFIQTPGIFTEMPIKEPWVCMRPRWTARNIGSNAYWKTMAIWMCVHPRCTPRKFLGDILHKDKKISGLSCFWPLSARAVDRIFSYPLVAQLALFTQLWKCEQEKWEQSAFTWTCQWKFDWNK